jgi:hypothetical protein
MTEETTMTIIVAARDDDGCMVDTIDCRLSASSGDGKLKACDDIIIFWWFGFHSLTLPPKH